MRPAGRAGATAASSTATGATCRGCASASATRARSRSRGPSDRDHPGRARLLRAPRGRCLAARGRHAAGVRRAGARPRGRGEVEAAREFGVPDEAVPPRGRSLAERIRSPRFRKGVFLRDGATVQPARLVRSAAPGRRSLGAPVHEHSRVTTSTTAVVETARGRVRARESSSPSTRPRRAGSRSAAA